MLFSREWLTHILGPPGLLLFSLLCSPLPLGRPFGPCLFCMAAVVCVSHSPLSVVCGVRAVHRVFGFVQSGRLLPFTSPAGVHAQQVLLCPVSRHSTVAPRFHSPCAFHCRLACPLLASSCTSLLPSMRSVQTSLSSGVSMLWVSWQLVEVLPFTCSPLPVLLAGVSLLLL